MKPDTLSAKILAIRPYSLGNSVILVLIASALAHTDGSFHRLPALLCLLFALFMQCTANLVNDLCDTLKGADRDDRLGPDRAAAKGLLTHAQIKRGIAFYTILAILSGLGILFWALEHHTLIYGGWELVVVGALCVIFAFLYTAGPFALAYHAMGDLAVVIFFGLVPVTMSYYVMVGSVSTEAVIASLACGLVIDTMLMLNNFRDVEEDRKSNKNTVVVLFGRQFGLWAYLALGMVASLLCLSLIHWGHIWAGVLPQLYLFAHVRTWRMMAKIDHGEQLNLCLGKTARNILMFGALFAMGFLIG